jgi:hypothetical protein
VGTIAAVLAVCVLPLGMVGAIAAALGFLAGRLAANAHLLGPARAVIARTAASRDRAAGPDAAGPPAPTGTPPGPTTPRT